MTARGDHFTNAMPGKTIRARSKRKASAGTTVFATLMRSRPLYCILRWALALIFIYAGGSKLFDPSGFALLINDYGLVPESWVPAIAILLPALEVVAALALLADLRGSLAVLTLLMALFIAILGYGIWMGLDVDCGCFGPEDPEALVYHGLRPALYRDLMLLLVPASLYGWRWRYRVRPRPWPSFRRSVSAMKTMKGETEE